MTGVVVLVVALVVAGGLGLWHRRTTGRFRPAAEPPTGPHGAEPDPPLLDIDAWRALGAEPGDRATLLQFSSAFCAPCRTTRVVLADVASLVPGVAHVEVDAEQHLDLVRRLGVLRTPTTLVLDAAGTEATRASGAPDRAQVLTALSRIVDIPSEE